jgi:WD40 repeat protein
MYGLSEASDNTNIVRYSPNGAWLASGADDKCVVIWEKREGARSLHSPERMVRWCKRFPLSGHAADVLDLAWSRDSRYVVSVGMDHRLMIWQVEKKGFLALLDSHEKFVQGVAVDPSFEHIVSCSNDRSCRVWRSVKSRKQVSFFVKRVLKRFNYNRRE